jgi:cytochrome c553
MWKGTAPQLFTAAVVSIGMLAGLGPLVSNAKNSQVSELKALSDFSAIADTAARSKAIFQEASRVITDPRCMNCHPATRSPTQGDDMHPHVPPITAADSPLGTPGMMCTTCHGPENRIILGSRLESIPGNSHWQLAPASMAWQGLSLGEICRQVKDPARNGNRTHADLLEHMGKDHLVGWAWHPGDGRRPAPGTQESFAVLIAAWINTGAECPD